MNASLAPQSRRSQWSQTTRIASRHRESFAANLKAVPLATALLLGSQISSARTYYRAQALPELQPQGPFGEGWTQGWTQDWVLATDITGGGNYGLLLLRPGQAALNLGLIVGGDIRFNPMINANGMVAGTTSIAVGGQNIAQGFLWTETGGARTFGVLAGNSTRLGGLNDNGLVVGDTFAPAGSSIPDGFIYNANTGTLLQFLPGFTPTDINNAGAIVGIQYGGSVPQGSSAAEWRNGAAVNLNSVTSDLGVYHLVQAVDINASGRILAFGQVNPALAGTN